MNGHAVARHRTAMARTGFSRPVALALEHGLIGHDTTVFDYGCGRGDDVRRLIHVGVAASGWDPVHASGSSKTPAEVVNLGFVLNVIEDPRERLMTLAEAWSLARDVLVVAVRPEWEVGSVEGSRFGDGVITRKGTFQKFFSHEEFRHLVTSVTGADPVVVAPGIAFAFKNTARAQDFKARSVRLRSALPRVTASEARFEHHRELLEPLTEFIEERGHLPQDAEKDPRWRDVREAFGSLRAAFGLVRRVTGEDRWMAARRRAEENLAVFLALAAFGGRPRWSQLSPELQADVRALYGNYKRACEVADDLLFGLGDREKLDFQLRSVPVGKVLPDAVYLHVSALAASHPVLRLYDGCARVLVGEVPGANVVKLSREHRQVSYLSYPGFDKVAHPPLTESLRIDLQTFSMKHRDYTASPNPPILHRKETLVSSTYPGYERFRRLTAAEVKAGLLDADIHIGNRSQWESLLASQNVQIRGHRLMRAQRNGGPDA